MPYRFSGSRSGKGIETLSYRVREASMQAWLAVGASAKVREGSCDLITIGTSWAWIKEKSGNSKSKVKEWGLKLGRQGRTEQTSFYQGNHLPVSSRICFQVPWGDHPSSPTFEPGPLQGQTLSVKTMNFFLASQQVPSFPFLSCQWGKGGQTVSALFRILDTCNHKCWELSEHVAQPSIRGGKLKLCFFS